MAWRLFCAWRYGGEDPWKLFHLLDDDYRPIGSPDLPPVRPKHPNRLRSFILAMGKVAAIQEGLEATPGAR